LKTVTALRRFGVEVTLQAYPVLPYGDWKADAGRFAEMLVEHGDYVYVRSITDGDERTERRIRSTPLAKKLAQDREYHWLRPDTTNIVIGHIEKMAPEKLKAPQHRALLDRQLRMFGT